MNSPTFAFVIWEDGSKSVIRCSKITEGVAAPNENVRIKYGKGRKTWAAKVMEVGKTRLTYTCS